MWWGEVNVIQAISFEGPSLIIMQAGGNGNLGNLITDSRDTHGKQQGAVVSSDLCSNPFYIMISNAVIHYAEAAAHLRKVSGSGMETASAFRRGSTRTEPELTSASLAYHAESLEQLQPELLCTLTVHSQKFSLHRELG